MYRKGLIKNLTREEFNIVKPNNIGLKIFNRITIFENVYFINSLIY